MPPRKIYLNSLGCAKNLVDSEKLLGWAVAAGFRPTGEPEEADLVLVNTCAFLQSAVEEALAEILDLAARRRAGARLVVAGCLPARYEAEELARDLPEVDLFLQPGRFAHWPLLLAGLFGGPERPAADPPPRVLSTPPFRAYLKIAEGCDHRCTYCLIPGLRGPLISQPPQRLVEEAETLAAQGVLELTLVAQDLTAYGRDLGGPGNSLPDLVRRLSAVEGLRWLRLLYAYPESLNERLIRELAATPKVLPYLDLPFQHVSLKILKRMGRPPASPLKLLDDLRAWWPDLALRTTLMVGFPGEGEKEFGELYNFVNQAALDHLGVFKFSPEPEAPASRLSGTVPQRIKELRRRKIMALQRSRSRLRNRERLGRTVPVLVEGPSADSELVRVGRGPFQAPEVDGLIYFEGPQPPTGEIVPARLVKAGDYDLVGRWDSSAGIARDGGA